MNAIAYKIIYGNSVPARFDGRCPYAPCNFRGFIRKGQPIVKGDKGWGHAECINMKTHIRDGDHAKCLTTSDIMLRLTDAYHQVTCKKCLKKLETAIKQEVLE